MSCCTNGPVTVKVYPNAPAVCPDTPEYVFENANLSGQGVFLSHTGTNVQFMGIASSGGTIDVTLDAPNNTINIEIDDAIVAGNFPDSTTTIKGKTAYSTNAEALAKTSTTKAVTPSNFAAMGASTTFAGLVELATEAETQSGSSSTLAVTPAGLLSVTLELNLPLTTANQPATETTTPVTAGQLLLQRDTRALYAADTTAEGDWELVGIPRTGAVSLTGDVTVTGSSSFIFSTRVETEGILNFDVANGSLIHRNGAVIPANSILVTGATAGQLSYVAANQFVGPYAVETYVVSGTASREFDSATVTLVELADVVQTLISDLAASKKPQF